MNIDKIEFFKKSNIFNSKKETMTTITYQTYYYLAQEHSTMIGGVIPSSAREFYLKTENSDQMKVPDQIRAMIHPSIMEDKDLVSGLTSGSLKVACTIVKKIDGVESGVETVILY